MRDDQATPKVQTHVFFTRREWEQWLLSHVRDHQQGVDNILGERNAWRDAHIQLHETIERAQSEQREATHIATRTFTETVHETAIQLEKLQQAHKVAHHDEHEAHAAAHLAGKESTQTAITRTEASIRETAAAHERLHDAHEKAHDQQHAAHTVAHASADATSQTAIQRGETTARETAAIHAKAHEREHELAQLAIDKADQRDNERFATLGGQTARAIDERGTFATKEALASSIATVVGRLDSIERTLVTLTERTSGVSANASRLDGLERTSALSTGRDHGVQLAWTVAGAAIFLFLTIAGYLATRGGA